MGNFCEDCKAKIEKAKPMEVVAICSTCVKMLNNKTKIETDKKYKMVAECKCGKQKICIEDLLNSYGYIERKEWQCPVCWQVVELTVKRNDEKE